MTLDLGDGVTIELAFIPAGVFEMGSPPDEPGRDTDELLHPVEITRPFYIGKHEVTQGQWEAVTGNNPSFFPGDASLPVDSVTHDEALEFCRLLSKQIGRKVRLPTEAEWEFAARASTTTAFSSGDDLSPTDANFDWSEGGADAGETLERTAPVGTFPPNPWGLFDVHGNVREWCADWYGRDAYESSSSSDPRGSETGTEHVLRGGSWDDYARRCRSAYRHGVRSDDRPEANGLRIVVEVPSVADPP